MSATNDEIQVVTIRVPKTLLTKIDESVAEKTPLASRHQWILEALEQRINLELAQTILIKLTKEQCKTLKGLLNQQPVTGSLIPDSSGKSIPINHVKPGVLDKQSPRRFEDWNG